MLNIYDGILKLSNPKLYHSPYKANIDEVNHVLKNYKFSVRMVFLSKLTNLIITNLDYPFKDEITMSIGCYSSDSNVIYLDDLEDEENVINHELFHALSGDGIVLDDGIFCLNEGITQYLHFKSRGLTGSEDVGYQLEVFVIEFLIFVYGEDIIKPYFDKDGKKFYKQFGKCKHLVRIINVLLDRINNKTIQQDYRLRYLLANELFKENVPEYKIDELQLNSNSMGYVRDFFAYNSDVYYELNKYCEEYNVDAYSYPYSQDNMEYSEEWKEEYIFEVSVIFGYILDYLLEIANFCKIDKNSIKEFVDDSFSNKDEVTREIYSDVLNKKFDLFGNCYYNKRR